MPALKMCSIYDSKAEAWMTPMFFQAIGQAVRTFSDTVNNADSPFGKHPEDYTLFEVGAFNEQTGEVTTISPRSIMVGVNLVQGD